MQTLKEIETNQFSEAEAFLEKFKTDPEGVENSIIKKEYLSLLDTAFEEAETDRNWAEKVVPALLELNILDKSDKEKYLSLLDTAFKKAETDRNWAEYVVPALLGLNILDKSDKEKYLSLLDTAFKKAETDKYWAEYVVPALLGLNILDKSDKEKYLSLLDTAVENAETDRNWAQYVVPALLELNILDKSEIKEASSNTYTINSLRHISVLTKHKKQISVDDIVFMEQIDSILTREEQKLLLKKSYQFFSELREGYKNKDYQKIRDFKNESYPEEEQKKLESLVSYFGNELWVYFFDKVNRNKDIKNRFRDPHNALLHVDKIIGLAKELETKGVSKTDFIKNYLGVAGDRNGGYQQLNDFLIKYDHQRKDKIEAELVDPDGLKDQAFLDYANMVLEKEKSRVLYQNIDQLETIITTLSLLSKKENLKKLEKLSDSDDPKDQLRYHYFRNAIFHPRTTPIIMDLYENPNKFLGLDDNTFRDINHIHQAKKPSNMVENFPYLDFDANDLVDCLALAVYDQVGYFKPFEKQYLIDNSRCYPLDKVKNEIKSLIELADKKKISVIIRSFNNMYPDNILSFKQWQQDKHNFIEDLLSKHDLEDLIGLFVSLGYQEFNKYRNTKLMTAKISPKSDPNNRFNGFNCDSLAENHGKKVVAMFNPYCTDFCIYEGEQDKDSDNLKVTSWITLNRKIPQNFNSLLEKAKSNTTHDIATLFGDEFDEYKDPKEYIMTMDNIEANSNFGNSYALAVAGIYEDFFSDYIKSNPISPNKIPINTKYFQSGMSYNKINIFNKRIENNTLPVFVNAYTDNAGSESLQGDLHIEKQLEKEKKVGVHPLSIEDVIQISYLEGKIYPEDLKSHIGNMQHEITASILNNTLKGRKNLSFTRYDQEGKLRGYLLAYQGKMDDGRTGIYISDFAIDEKSRGRSGVEMINNWIKQVKNNYPNIPIFTMARESTSYRMIKALAKRNDYDITSDKKENDNGEQFHWVIMEPINS